MAQTTSEVWDSRWSATRRTLRPERVDNYFEEYPTLKTLRQSGMRISDRGGKEISVILETSGGSATAFDKYDTLDKSPVDPFETAHYKRRYYAVPIILSDTENWENSGEEQIFDLLEALGQNATKSLLKAINEDIYSAQTGKNILGLQDLAADTSGATIGGIDSSATTEWDNQRDTSSTTFLTQSTTNVFNGIDKWQDVIDSIRIYGGKVNQIWTTFSIARAYRVALSSQGYARTELSDAGGVGGDWAPNFYGAKVVADNDCPSLHCYFISNGALKLNVLSSCNFRKTPFVSLQSNAQLAQLAYMVAGVQLTTNNRRRLGVATAITGT